MPCSAFDPAVRMALAPFRRERAVKKILLVKALPLRVVLLYRTAGWNARLFRKSLCKRLCKSLKTLSSAGGRPFRRSSGAAGGGESGPPRAGDIRHDMAWECRRPAAGAKGEKGTAWFPFPLLTPPNPPSSRSAKHSRLNGGYGGSVPCVGQILGCCYALNLLCVNRRA